MKIIKTFLFSLVVMAIIAFLFHFLMLQFNVVFGLSFKQLFFLHSVLFAMTYFVIRSLLKIKKADADKVGFAFLVGVVVKLILAALFFHFYLPKTKSVVLQFMFLYLIYLFFETYSAYQIIVSKTSENQKEK